ncbi:hypothetical protein Acr_15g0000250 [Actinidia rufa]|uniref:Uncharacterized protein n=1 Tax=Actinidia rufa TaxID=165716 RepID=A0A7J0FRT0_9ERIC|nr:hypothetical protein Acr_15g0000250 [Actinidia rufa]
MCTQRGTGSMAQNSIAEAASAAQSPPAAPTGQAYNYPSHGPPAYGSPPSNLVGPAPPVDYAYGINYSY